MDLFKIINIECQQGVAYKVYEAQTYISEFRKIGNVIGLKRTVSHIEVLKQWALPNYGNLGIASLAMEIDERLKYSTLFHTKIGAIGVRNRGN
eukprot:CAMPEP_0184649948 /NCGR_PEP_ID=MMETSP0308-20130426/7413_1 /TAXON_ID=38269 /ORGANISM="Gloeochaete witrockiana, Strain SAG 46.84" /LENGTH=92 /DNA_ID=CAMNT_0027083103 /DNA_START=1081 /DNA_END=1359 /DNA_ORIENTATION=+